MLRHSVSLLILSVTVLLGNTRAGKLTSAPVVGVLTIPGESALGNCKEPASLDTTPVPGSCFLNYYVQWLQSAGARVAYIPYDASEEELSALFDATSGFLLTGGGLSLKPDTQYYKAARFMVNKATQANLVGDHFPVWGTCMGFQLLSILAANDWNILSRNAYVGTEDSSLPLDFVPAAHESRLFGPSCPKSVKSIFTHENVTTNRHHDGVLPSKFRTSRSLLSTYQILATNVDTKGTPFVAAMEGREVPFFGVQFHPERSQFQFEDGRINHSADAVTANRYLADFFVAQARRSPHSFPSTGSVMQNLVENFNPRGANSYKYFAFPVAR